MAIRNMFTLILLVLMPLVFSKKIVERETFLQHQQRDDCVRYKRWANNSSEGACSNLPRVLIYTWLTEDYYPLFENEIYWKLCYAHMHGFDAVFSDEGKPTNPGSYSDDMMWAFSRGLRKLLDSKDFDYDYVFAVGGDVEFVKANLYFPVWEYDTGHPLTIMDQSYADWGFNENSMLFKVSPWTRKFLDKWYFDHRGHYNLQGDNGPYMETILGVISNESQVGRPGYDGHCLKTLRLDEPQEDLMAKNMGAVGARNAEYSRCFFAELDRLAGPWGKRTSVPIGFSPTNDFSTPWANCWSHIRDRPELEPAKNCFAYHWNGAKDKSKLHKVQPECPAPTFGKVWKESPYNPQNRLAAR